MGGATYEEIRDRAIALYFQETWAAKWEEWKAMDQQNRNYWLARAAESLRRG